MREEETNNMSIARRDILFIVAAFTFHVVPSAAAQEVVPAAVAEEEPEPPDVSQASASPEEIDVLHDEQASASQADVSLEEIDRHNEVAKAAKKETVDENIEGNKTGTDPRDFSNKWQPYYRYTKLRNGLRQHDLTPAGIFAFTPRLGAIWETPLARYRDFSEIAGLPAGAPTDTIGLGDVNFKFIGTPKAFEFSYAKEGKMRGNVLLGTDFTFPTATDDLLGGNALLFGPIVALVMDMPLHGFIALLNEYVFDLYRSDGTPRTSSYLGQWFYMQPLTPPGKWWGGFYLLPEFQLIYDGIARHTSMWLAPEVGKGLAPGKILYAKPGFGVRRNSKSTPTDRQFTMEVGFRWFF
jgi:hypothetical protein